MQWTQGQIEAKNNLVNWANTTTVTQADFFRCIEGPAGSGKSTVVDAIIKELSHLFVIGAAPTHAAKDVLIDFTNLACYTVHQLLGLKPDVNLEYYNPANPIYAQLNEDLFETSANLIIIDEASMLNQAIVKMLCERALCTNKKILFIGESVADVKPL